MLQFYKIIYETWYCGEFIYSYDYDILDDKPPEDLEDIIVSWDNVDSVCSLYSHRLGFNLLEKKRGKVIDFYYSNLLSGTCRHKLREWKQDEFNLIIRRYCKPYVPSIQEVLKWRNGEKAIQYLLERGLTVFPAERRIR